jgi:two-component system CheB/CheR fusion protein
MNDELHRHSDEFGAYRHYVDAVLRGLDAGVVVVDLDKKVRYWNRWSENTWGLREEAAIDQVFGALDIGLPGPRAGAGSTGGDRQRRHNRSSAGCG